MTYAANTATATAYNNGTAHKIVGAVAAIAATLLLQGTLLTGFDQLAARDAVNAAATTQMATLPAVTVVHKRG
jgi:hypothetical protein